MSNYQNDPNINRPRHPLNDGRSYTGWIIGGVIALAVILGIFMLTGRNDNTNRASNSPASTATTGSAIPAPRSGMGTAGDNHQNPSPVPTVPAR